MSGRLKNFRGGGGGHGGGGGGGGGDGFGMVQTSFGAQLSSK